MSAISAEGSELLALLDGIQPLVPAGSAGRHYGSKDASMSAYKEVVRIVSNYTLDENILPSDTLRSLKFESLDRLEMEMAIEDEFGEIVPDGVFTLDSTVKQIADYIDSKRTS